MTEVNTAGQELEKDEYDEWFSEDDDETYAYDDSDYEAQAADEEGSEEDSSPDDDLDDVPAEEVPDTGAKHATGEGTSADQEEQEEDPYSWVAELDPDFRKKAESLVNATRSNAGRAAAEARKNAQLKAQLDQLAAEREAFRRTVAGTSAEKPDVTAKDVEEMNDEELKEFMEEYPNVARNVQKLIEERTRRTRDEVLSQIRPIQQEAEAARLYEAKQRLRHEAELIFNTAETGVDLDAVLTSTRWKEWQDSQPDGYKQFIANANTVEDSVKVLRDFADHAEREMYAMYQQQQESQQETERSSADETAARRKSALKGSTPKSRSAEISNRRTGASYEDIFNEIVESGG